MHACCCRWQNFIIWFLCGSPRLLHSSSVAGYRLLHKVLAIVNNAVNITMNIVIVAAVKLRLTLCDPMVCTSPGSSVHGISQGRILEWLTISFSRGSSQPRGQTCVSCIGRQILYHWATRACWCEHWGVKVRCSPMWTLRCLYLFKWVSFFLFF